MTLNQYRLNEISKSAKENWLMLMEVGHNPKKALMISKQCVRYLIKVYSSDVNQVNDYRIQLKFLHDLELKYLKK